MKTKSKLVWLLLIAIVISANWIDAQDKPAYFQSQYLSNPILINPAIAGSKFFTVVHASYRQNIRYQSISPKSQIITFHTRLSKNRNKITRLHSNKGNYSPVALGATINNDVHGPFRRIGGELTYSYHIPVNFNSSFVSFGLSATGYFYSIDYSNINVVNDPIISEGKYSSFYPDANIGVYYYTERFYLGASLMQMLNVSSKFSGYDIQTNDYMSEFFFLLGHRFSTNRLLMIEPYILYNLNGNNSSGSPLNGLDINFKMYYQSVCMGISYGLFNSVTFLSIYQTENLYIGIAYETMVGATSNISYGQAEIFIGINIGKGRN